jgi:Uncharacterized conserved protein
MSDDEREALCRRCGICCHEKIRFGEMVVITDVPCKFLDVETNLCTVYEERFSRQPLCTTAARSAEAGALPDDCPYVGGISKYPAPQLLSDHPEYERAVDTMFPERKNRGKRNKR